MSTENPAILQQRLIDRMNQYHQRHMYEEAAESGYDIAASSHYFNMWSAYKDILCDLGISWETDEVGQAKLITHKENKGNE